MAKSKHNQHKAAGRSRKSGQRDAATSSGTGQRRMLADEAARILANDGLLDFQMAKRKAAQHLGFNDTSQWPANDEIEQALTTHLQLFGGRAHDAHIAKQLLVALEAMTLFEPFNPRLTGALLRGSATAHTPIELHLFADTQEDVTVFLFNAQIEYELCDKQIRTGNKHRGNNQHERVMGVRLEVDPNALDSSALDTIAQSNAEVIHSGIEQHIAVVALIFPPDAIRHPPKSPIDGLPMQRANIDLVQSMLKDMTASG